MLLSEIKGIGEKRVLALNKQGFFTPLDLLYFFPYAYVDTRTPCDARACADGQAVFVRGTVADKSFRYLRKGLTMVRARLKTEYGDVHCTWFNQKYITAALEGEIGVYGTVEHFKSTVSLKAPVLIREDGIVPLYRPLKGVPSNVLKSALAAVFRRVTVKSVIPDTLTAAFGLPALNDCFRQLHFPTDAEQAETARRAIEIDRLAYELACFRLLKARKVPAPRAYKMREPVETLLARLPYALTDGQKTALEEILAGMRGADPMNRLLQGDVGCGKTIVALLAMYYAAVNGYQAVLMAPTELLAAQHYKTALALFADTDIRLAYVTGSQTAREREDALFRIRHGDAGIVIGTHALLGENVHFARLALTVIDEQHRFGVNQRAALEAKAEAADTLVMSATPIPRTVALTYYGDLEQSVIDTMPRRKAQTFTRLVPSGKTDAMYEYLREKAAAGESAYIVCPRVEDEELTSAASLYARLSKTALQPYLALLHGKQKEADKRRTMDMFAAGEVRILVTTTVVEVGIDVADATTMVIMDADRYGLSQLHQLRGRVGRGTKDSYCFLLTESEPPERLRFFVQCGDGFRLAEYDFRTRGAGDFLGTRQHGGGIAVTTDAMDIARKLADATMADETIRSDMENFTSDGMKYLTLN
ncbi:MAG: ATP-dependent DNA helicase RecG [Clostridia bacterium]|nr:ATP-dependent DNA helicase RecG [Clostridia bacterium]